MNYFFICKIWLVVFIIDVNIFLCCKSHENSWNVIREIRIYQFIHTLKNAFKINNGVKIDQFILNNIIHGDGKNYSVIKSDYYFKSKGACSRCNLIVNFKELGFTHILYPLDIDIGLCNGHCKDLKNLSEHAKLLFLSKTETPGKSTCCYANAYNDISIYFQKGDNYYTKLIERSVIDTCECS